MDSRDKVVPSKQQKVAHVKGKRKASSAESGEDQTLVEVHPLNSLWDPRVGLEEAAILWNSNIREF